MRTCPKCGADVFPGASDCPRCGVLFASDGSWSVPPKIGAEANSVGFIASFCLNLNAAAAVVLLVVPALIVLTASSPIADLIHRLDERTGFASNLQLKRGDVLAISILVVVLLCWFAVGRVRGRVVLASKRRIAGQVILLIVTSLFLVVSIPALAGSNANNSYAGGWIVMGAWLLACLPWLIGLSLHYFGAANAQAEADTPGAPPRRPQR